MRKFNLGMLLLTLYCVSASAEQPVAAKQEPETIAQRVLKARNNKDPEEVITAIESLASITEKEETSNQVVEHLMDMVKTNKDIFVRIAAIETLGKIQVSVTKDDKAKEAYRDSFKDIFLNKEEHSKVRVAIVNVFRQTLVLKGKNELPDREAFKSGPLEIVKIKTENEALREACILCIGDFGRAMDVEVLATLLSEPNDRIRAAAAASLELLMLKNPTEVQLSVPTVNNLVEMLPDVKLEVPLRLSVMRVLAQLVRLGNPTARDKAFPQIIKLSEFINSQNDDLVYGAIASLGVIANADAVVPLIKTYDHYLGSKSADVLKIRICKAVVKAMRAVLIKQNEERTVDAKAIKLISEKLVKIVDDDPSLEVKDSAIFVMRYFWPKKFEAEHKEIVSALIFQMKDCKDELRKKKINASLEAITDVTMGLDYDKWFEWYDKKWPKKAGGTNPK